MHANNINLSLSEQERQVVESILSIQDYYRLKDHRRLISIITDRNESQQLFSPKMVMISDVFAKQKGLLDDQAKVQYFSEKYTYENLIDKFKNPKSYKTNMLIAVFKKKMESSVITSHHTRKSMWLLASGALFLMRKNPGLYWGLVSYPAYPKYYERAIMLDLHRTVKKSQSSDEDTRRLQNVLIAFSRRNPYIGYCQGLNFIAYFLLTMQFNEEQAFWLLCQIIETIIPMDYYTNMIGVACDQQIFTQILKQTRPKIIQKFNEVGLDGSVLSIQWFVCLFTSSLPFCLVKIVWDRLLIQGTQAFIKAGLIILTHFEQKIMQTKQFYEIIMLVEQGSKNLNIPEQEFNLMFEQYYINQQGLKIARDLYRQFHIKQKLDEKLREKETASTTSNDAPRKRQLQECNPSWPLCTQALDQIRKSMFQIQVWTYRQDSSPKIIHDYMDNIKKKETQMSLPGQIKTQLKESKDIGSDPLNYVIGRMHHVCNSSSQTVEYRRSRKEKANPLILSMIMEQDEDDEKKMSMLQRITSEAAELGDSAETKDETPHMGFQKSQTIQFYNQFVNNNKELVEMIVGKR